MIQGILFDMDGILFDTERTSIDVSLRIAEEWGFALPEGYVEAVCGASHEAYRHFMVENLGEGFDFDAYHEETHRRFAAWLDEHGVPKMPGVDEALAWLKGNGYKIAIASSSRYDTVLHHIRDAGLEPYFDAVVGGDMVCRTKPEPEIFLKAAEALGLPPACCVAVEDSVNGVIAAHRAGCITVMIPDTKPATDELRALTAAVLPSLAALPAFVEGYEDAN